MSKDNRTWHCEPYTAIVEVKEFDDEFGIPPSKYKETRYRVVDNETGKVLDDAQGYGYRTRQKAFLGYSWVLKRREERRKNAN